MDEKIEAEYLKLSQVLKIWKRGVKQHCHSGIDIINRSTIRVPDCSDCSADLHQVRHEFFEILDHLK